MRIKKISNDEIQNGKPSASEVRLKKRTPVCVVLDGVRSKYNIGSIFRSSDATLVEKVFLTGISPQPPHPAIDKSALGATDVVPWQYCPSAAEAVKDLKARGFFIVALELTHSSIPYSEMKYKFPMCLIIGNEVDGVSDDLLDLCDAAIDIPMHGRANSLNVANAYSIAIFEILRQYNHDRA